MANAIEALYIYDEHDRPIVCNTFRARPLSASHLLPLYLAYPTPRPSFIYLPNTSPQTLVFSLTHANLLFLLTSSSDIEPLLALEFLHRTIDVLEEFLGAPLLSSKIEGSYDVVAQLLNEMCDAGAISTTEGNALRDLVEVEGLFGKLLGTIAIPGKPGFTSTTPTLSPTGMPGISSLGPATSGTAALPWRRANVRHTSNELYVDLVESLSIILAPSGRPISAFANGTIAFTSKVSGVPDLLLTLSTPSGKQNFENVMELPVFHPCVRLARWREHPGELSFVPPDGRFVLAGYEVNLAPFGSGKLSASQANLKLPVSVEVKTSLGPVGQDFEVRISIMKVNGQGNSSGFSASAGRSSGRLGSGTPGFGASGSSSPSSTMLDGLVITVPIPADVRNVTDIRASRGDTTYSPGEKTLEWSIPTRETTAGSALLHCTVVGPSQNIDDEEGNGFSFDGTMKINDDDHNEGAYQSGDGTPAPVAALKPKPERDEKLVEKSKILMPTSTHVSFSVKGWLASGIKVESVNIDPRKSRGLGENVRPYKGVKYLSVSNGGLEIRC